MKVSRSQVFWWLLAAIGVALVVALISKQTVSPADEYLKVVKKQLPSGVSAVLHGTAYTDNLFHKSYVWEFEHSPEGLASLLSQLGVGTTYEDYEKATDLRKFDTPWVLPEIGDALGKGIPLSDIGRGYEIESSSRDNWFLVSKDGARSYLEWNGP